MPTIFEALPNCGYKMTRETIGTDFDKTTDFIIYVKGDRPNYEVVAIRESNWIVYEHYENGSKVISLSGVLNHQTCTPLDPNAKKMCRSLGLRRL